MYEHTQRTYSADNIKAKSTATSETERRSGDRQPFTAAAEVVDLGSGARFSTRTTDLGSGGCFVDTIVPFPVDSKVRVTIRRGKITIRSRWTRGLFPGRVRYGYSFRWVGPETEPCPGSVALRFESNHATIRYTEQLARG